MITSSSAKIDIPLKMTEKTFIERQHLPVTSLDAFGKEVFVGLVTHSCYSVVLVFAYCAAACSDIKGVAQHY